MDLREIEVGSGGKNLLEKGGTSVGGCPLCRFWADWPVYSDRGDLCFFDVIGDMWSNVVAFLNQMVFENCRCLSSLTIMVIPPVLEMDLFSYSRTYPTRLVLRTK